MSAQPLRSSAAIVMASAYGGIIPAPVVVQAAAKAPAESLMTIVKPEARDRWSAAVLRHVTPERIENILRGAVSGSLVAQWELFDLMEDTWPRLKKNLNEVKRSVQKVDWSVSPFIAPGQKEPSKKAKAKADLATAAIWGTRPDIAADESAFEDLIYDACDAVGKGISIQENLWELRAGAVMPRAWQWIHPRHYGYPFNSASLQLDVDGLGTTWQPFPPDKFVIATFKTKTGHLSTSAMLRSLATFWIGASFSYDWALNLAQIFGIPFRWANYDPTISPRVFDDLCEMLANMGSAGWGAFPQGTTLEFKEAVQSAANNPQSWLISVADIACDILILGQTLTTSQGDKGSQALGTVHSDVRSDVIEFCGSWVAKVLQYQVIAPLMRMNFGANDEDPTLIAEIEQSKDGKAMAERDKMLIVDMGMTVPKQWLYERHEVPMPEDGEDVFEPKATAPAPSPTVPGKAPLNPDDIAKAKAVEIPHLTGSPINSRRTAFAPESGTLGVPRTAMPQVASEHRGALANYLRGRGIEWQNEDVLPGSLKPTQGDFNPGKVDKARAWVGESNRRILVSADDHVVDGHHQWLARMADQPLETMPAIRLHAPVRDILGHLSGFPSAGMEKAPDIAISAKGAEADPATAKLADAVLEGLTGVEARWLGGVKPVFVDLLNAAQDEAFSDELLIQAIERSADQMPELFDQLDSDAVIDAMERAMGPAVVNGAVSAYLRMYRAAQKQKAGKGDA